jgi:hypothetical protein
MAMSSDRKHALCFTPVAGVLLAAAVHHGDFWHWFGVVVAFAFIFVFWIHDKSWHYDDDDEETWS